MTTLQEIHTDWAQENCPQRKAPDQCNKWRGDAPYVDAVRSVEPDTVLRTIRQLAQNDLLDPQLEVAYTSAFRVWIAPPVHTQFALRDSAAAAWREARPDISSREHNQKWRDKFIRLAFEVLHRVLITDPVRVRSGHLVDEESDLLEQILTWAGQATETRAEQLPSTNPLRTERVLIATEWRSRLTSRARKLGLAREDAEDVASEAILNYLNASPADDVPLLWKQLEYAIRRHQRIRTRQHKLAVKVTEATRGHATTESRGSTQSLTGLSQDALCLVEAILGADQARYTESFFLTALERGDKRFGALPDSEKRERLEEALTELRTKLGGDHNA